MQDSITPTRVGRASGWAAGACGYDFALAVKKHGGLWAWGHNYVGQLGLGDTATRLTPTRVGTANDWASVSCGDGDALAVRTDGALWAWGFNGNGELGLGDNKERHAPTEVRYAVPHTRSPNRRRSGPVDRNSTVVNEATGSASRAR